MAFLLAVGAERANAFAPAAAILSISISTPEGQPLPAAGERVVVSVHVRNATTCEFFRQFSTFSSLYPYETVPCASGHASVTVPPIANAYKAPVRLTYAVRARGAGTRSTQRTVTVAEAAAPRTPQPPVAPPPLSPPTPAWSTSPNWSGYVVPSSSALVTDASGQWTVPTINCSATPTGDATTWVGIGGFGWPSGGTSGALLQTGVSSNCVSGVPRYEGWWEEYPSNPNHASDFANFPVSPGDSIQAFVFQGISGAWETRVDDLTTGLSGVMVIGQGWGVTADGGDGSFVEQGSTAGLAYEGGYTAEWIVEDPGLSGLILPFADYGTVNFTSLRTSLLSWSLTSSEGIAIAQNGAVLSTPSSPSNSGFSVSYTG